MVLTAPPADCTAKAVTGEACLVGLQPGVVEEIVLIVSNKISRDELPLPFLGRPQDLQPRLQQLAEVLHESGQVSGSTKAMFVRIQSFFSPSALNRPMTPAVTAQARPWMPSNPRGGHQAYSAKSTEHHGGLAWSAARSMLQQRLM